MGIGNEMERVIRQLRFRFWLLCRFFINRANRKRLTDPSPAILASNCLGGIILHDLHLPFLTPTINLFMPAQDFLRFAHNMDRYLASAGEMVEVEHEKRRYPIGRLIDVNIHFVHYSTFTDAKKKWCARCRRVQHGDMVIIMTDRDGCTPEDVADFDRLPYEHKVIFTNRPYPEQKSAFYIPGFESEQCVGDLGKPSSILGKRYLDAFDYVSLINKAQMRGGEATADSIG